MGKGYRVENAISIKNTKQKDQGESNGKRAEINLSLSKQTEGFHEETVAKHHCVREILRLGAGQKLIAISTAR